MKGEVKRISSLTNERVKAIRALDMRKARKETGLFVAEGQAILMTARERGFVPETVVYQAGEIGAAGEELLRWALAAGAEVLEVTGPILAKLASKDNPQSMLGVFRQRWSEAPAARPLGGDTCWLALEEVRDPGNLGTIVRTADAAGAAGVILVGTCCDAYSREAIRATMGSIFSVPLVRMDRERLLAWLADWPGDVVGTHLGAKEDFRATRYRGPVLLLMGSEGPGLSPALLGVCTRLVKIPMTGELDSLNLAVAAALALYEVRRASLHL